MVFSLVQLYAIWGMRIVLLQRSSEEGRGSALRAETAVSKTPLLDLCCLGTVSNHCVCITRSKSTVRWQRLLTASLVGRDLKDNRGYVKLRRRCRLGLHYSTCHGRIACAPGLAPMPPVRRMGETLFTCGELFGYTSPHLTLGRGLLDEAERHNNVHEQWRVGATIIAGV